MRNKRSPLRILFGLTAALIFLLAGASVASACGPKPWHIVNSPNPSSTSTNPLLAVTAIAANNVGAGSGDLARRVVEFAWRVDAVDFFEFMIEQGRRLPNGDHPRLHWIYGKVEEAPLAPPYALITAGSSIHWMEWERVFPLFRSALTPQGSLALVYRSILPMPWDADMRKLRVPFSAHPSARGSHVVEELEARGFFSKQGEQETAPVSFSQSIEDFIEGLHSRSSFSRDLMGQQAAELDQQVGDLLMQYHPDGMLPLQVVGRVIWGTSESGTAHG